MINRNKLLLLLALLSAFPPLSTDMYLPALPFLQKIWGESIATINLTLVSFFASYCFFLLIYGPLSDRFGRRPLLLVGIGLFIISSFLCSASDNAVTLVIFRIFQGAGAAASSVLALAITKDVYEKKEREKVLAYIAVIMAVVPMLAPVFGGWVLIWFSWRWIFVFQALIAVVAWIGVFLMTETIKTPSVFNISRTASIYFELLQNKRFIGFASILSLTGLPHFAFIGGSAHIYINNFGLSEQAFGYYFAINAASIMLGSFTCTKLLKIFNSKKILTLSFAGILLGGIGIILNLSSGPWGLALPMAIISFSFGLSRPPSNNLILEQVNKNIGSASSLLVFIFFMIGTFSMWFISLDWENKANIIGILGFLIGGFLLVTWIFLPKNAH